MALSIDSRFGVAHEFRLFSTYIFYVFRGDIGSIPNPTRMQQRAAANGIIERNASKKIK